MFKQSTNILTWFRIISILLSINNKWAKTMNDETEEKKEKEINESQPGDKENPNFDLWNKVCQTDPKYTTKVTQGSYEFLG